jgi:hypothetical protein
MAGDFMVDARRTPLGAREEVPRACRTIRVAFGRPRAAYFTEGVERGDEGVRHRYFEMLKAGGSDDPYVLLKRAGFDASSPEAYRNGASHGAPGQRAGGGGRERQPWANVNTSLRDQLDDDVPNVSRRGKWCE